MGSSNWPWGRAGNWGSKLEVKGLPSWNEMKENHNDNGNLIQRKKERKKKKIDCYYWKVKCFVPATKQYCSQKPYNDGSSSPFLCLLACLAGELSLGTHRVQWSRKRGWTAVGLGPPMSPLYLTPDFVPPLYLPLLLHVSSSPFALPSSSGAILSLPLFLSFPPSFSLPCSIFPSLCPLYLLFPTSPSLSCALLSSLPSPLLPPCLRTVTNVQ